MKEPKKEPENKEGQRETAYKVLRPVIPGLVGPEMNKPAVGLVGERSWKE
uniref:Uncharacterized protein n=1 Tax=viral metagenome TaxID=1070528 RepID=A0A6M3KZP0_9ZZZZ